MRKEFYEIRGWDPASGLQKAQTLEELDMPDLAEDLKRMDLIQS